MAENRHHLSRFLTTTTLISSTAVAAIAAGPATVALAAATCAPANAFAAQTLTPPTAVAGGTFGFPAVTGDFNGDGYRDAAIGHPNDGVGSVRFYLGSPEGLVAKAALFPIVVPPGSAGWGFGGALAAGDFNGDGFDELAVGAPGTSSGGGSIQVYKGLAVHGLQSAQYAAINQEFAGETTEAGDRYGSALAAGDFNGDGKDDLAVGADEEAPAGSTVRSGEVNVLQGSASGLARGWIIRQAALGQTAKAGDEFGISLTAGKIVGDSKDDLIVGSRRKDVGTIVDTGAVFILDGAGNKLTSNPIFKTQGLLQDTPLDETNDQFGSTSAIGDFNKDGTPDLAVGIPLESYTRTTRRGSVQVFPGPVTKDSAGYYITPNSLEVPGDADLFGGTLLAGDIDGDSATDLLVGASGTPRSGLLKAGAVGIYSGTTGGVLRAERLIVQSDVGATDAANDAFGGSIALGDFDKDGRVDGIISAFGKTVNGVTGAGAAYVLDDLSPATPRDIDQNTPIEGLQSAPVGGDAVAPIRYAWIDNNGSARLAIQENPQSAGALTRIRSGLDDAFLTGRPALGQTSDGKGVLAARSVTGDLWMRTEVTPGQATWGPWVNYGGPDLGGIALTTLASGRLAVFGVGVRGEVSILQQLPSGGFGAWQTTGIGNWTGDPVAVSVSGGTRVFATDVDGTLQTALWNGSALTGCTSVGDRAIVGRPAVVKYPAGSRLRVFATTANHELITVGQNTSGVFDPSWATVQADGVAGAPAAIFDWTSNRITVSAVGTDNVVYMTTETGQGTNQFGLWTPFTAAEPITDVSGVTYTSSRDGYYFVYRDVNNEEIFAIPQQLARAAERGVAPKFIGKSAPKEKVTAKPKS